MKIPKSNKFSIDWPNHLIGFFSALFGILVAFELDQFRERQQDEEVAQIAFLKLKQEIQINKNMLHETVHTNLEMLYLLKDNVMPSVNDNIQFTGTRMLADSINSHARLMAIVFIDTSKWTNKKFNAPLHIVLGNLIQPVLQSSAWESAKAIGALNFMNYEKVLSLSSLYNAPKITDELADLKVLIRSSDDIKNKSQLDKLLSGLIQSHHLVQRELDHYDLFVSILEQME